MLKNIVLNLEDRIRFNHHPNLPFSFRMLIIEKMWKDNAFTYYVIRTRVYRFSKYDYIY